MSTVLVGLTGGSSFKGRRGCNGGGGCSCEKDRGGRDVMFELVSDSWPSRSE
jgi:hypothetical protein